jgi:esterase/lipase superfamily enzyme
MTEYVITVRAKGTGGQYTDNPGPTTFLRLPDDQKDYSQAVALSPDVWANEVQRNSGRVRDATGVERGDVLVFIHGYNNMISDVLSRHQLLKSGLSAHGFGGAIVSFDWPCDDVALAYLADRERAKVTAFQLVSDCIVVLARRQSQGGCDVNVHLLAHSTGAFVIREAFDDADDRNAIAATNWTVSQLAMIAGDVSSGSMASENSGSESIYRHSIRLTNYSNPYDEVLQLSNVKRVGVAPRLGRVGLPIDAPTTAVNVDCGAYYQSIRQLPPPPTLTGVRSHSWYFGDTVFVEDLAQTLNGNLDRSVITTRSLVAPGRYKLGAPRTQP